MRDGGRGRGAEGGGEERVTGASNVERIACLKRDLVKYKRDLVKYKRDLVKYKRGLECRAHRLSRCLAFDAGKLVCC